MLSLGSAAYLADKTLVGTFSINLETLPDAEGHPTQMAWWATQKKAWKACREDQRPPLKAMLEYVDWLDGLPGKPVFVAYPAGFDFTFVYWYLMKFVGRCPFSFQALDIKTMAMIMLGSGYRDATKRNMPKRWFKPGRHTHVALDDAIEQGILFCNILEEARKMTG